MTYAPLAQAEESQDGENPDDPANADAPAAWTDADTDARPVVVVAVIISAPFDITFARGIIVAVAVPAFDDNALATASTVAAAILVADQSHIFDVCGWCHGRADRERRGVRPG